jgi:hypothetical protein
MDLRLGFERERLLSSKSRFPDSSMSVRLLRRKMCLLERKEIQEIPSKSSFLSRRVLGRKMITPVRTREVAQTTAAMLMPAMALVEK